MSTFGLASAFYFNERFFHIDYIFKNIDPNIIVNTRELSNSNKDYFKFKIFQALVLDEISKEKGSIK